MLYIFIMFSKKKYKNINKTKIEITTTKKIKTFIKILHYYLC